MGVMGSACITILLLLFLLFFLKELLRFFLLLLSLFLSLFCDIFYNWGGVFKILFCRITSSEESPLHDKDYWIEILRTTQYFLLFHQRRPVSYMYLSNLLTNLTRPAIYWLLTHTFLKQYFVGNWENTAVFILSTARKFRFITNPNHSCTCVSWLGTSKLTNVEHLMPKWFLSLQR